MLFNSIDFALFLPIVFLLYWFVFNKRINTQNLFILLVSYFFYSCWDYRFLLLLIFSTFLDYFSGIKIHESKTNLTKKVWFWVSIGLNIGFLGFFKYYNFFADSFAEALQLIGFKADFWTLKVILPVGISFYTFHGLSYIIDIYKEKITPEKKFVNYAAFVCFFPLLVAGPIERASHLLPQIKSKRIFDNQKAVDGLRQILWGLFKKVVIADNCSTYVNEIFNNSTTLGGSTLIIGAVLFSIQVYCDFSGYSDIALGTARCFGFELLKNFNFPFLSKSVTEFWRRWHISLSTWFNDYLFTPMIIKWRDSGKRGIYLALIITFLTAGLWHGAGWNFLVYGLLHGIVLVLEMMTKKTRKKALSNLPSVFSNTLTIFLTFSFITFAFVFFRSKNLTLALDFCSNLFSYSIFSVPTISTIFHFMVLLLFILFFLIVEWKQNKYDHGLFFSKDKNSWFFRWSVYFSLVCAIILFGSRQQEFIYFQF